MYEQLSHWKGIPMLCCIVVTVVCFMPQAALLVMLHAERAEALETRPTPIPLKYREPLPVSVAEPLSCDRHLAVSLLADRVFATWLTQITLPVPSSGLCPTCL